MDRWFLLTRVVLESIVIVLQANRSRGVLDFLLETLHESRDFPLLCFLQVNETLLPFDCFRVFPPQGVSELCELLGVRRLRVECLYEEDALPAGFF